MDSKELHVAEIAIVNARREILGLPSSEKKGAVGLALSGGGIRSACYSLGVIQALKELNLWKEIDYLSSVSGGGYAAAAALYGHASSEPRDVIKSLQNNGGYISAKITEVFFAMVAALISLLLVFSPVVLMVIQALPIYQNPKTEHYQTFLLGISLFSSVVLAWSLWSSRKTGDYSYTKLLLAVFISILGWHYFNDYRIVLASGSVVLILLLLWILFLKKGKSYINKLQYIARFLLVPPFLILSAYLVWSLMDGEIESGAISAYPVALVVFITSLFLGSNWLNFLNWHYRRAIKSSFILHSDFLFDGGSKVDESPLHIINCCLQSPKSDDLISAHRASQNFAVSRWYCGSSVIGYYSTYKWYRKTGRFGFDFDDGLVSYGKKYYKLSDLITISGAALDTHPKRQSAGINALTIATNAGLGMWMSNPSLPHKMKQRSPAGFFMNFIAMLDAHSDKSSWMRLSDGGHFENLGIYELISRKLNLIAIVDAAHDPVYKFSDLAVAAQRCWEDFGAKIEIAGVSNSNPSVAKDCYLGKVLYSDGSVGKIIYFKLAIAQSHSLWLRLRSSVDKKFPQEPTTTQFVDRDFLSSYFELGYQTAMCGLKKYSYNFGA